MPTTYLPAVSLAKEEKIIHASAHAATVYSIDSHNADSPLTESGWTGLNAPTTTITEGTVNVGGTDGSRLRGSVGSPSPNALTGDFAFDDGAGEAIILFFGGVADLAAGTWQVEVWAFEASGGVGDQILGMRTGETENAATTINGTLQADGRVTDTMGSSATGSSATFTFLSIRILVKQICPR